MKLSAVIATANRAKELDEAFTTFINQSRPFDEIIIADSGSNDETRDLVDRWSSRLPLYYLKCEVMSAAGQRDIGIDACSGDIVFFLDDDILLEDAYVEEITRVFEDDVEVKIGGVSGTIVNQTYGTPSWITRQYFRLMAGQILDSYAGKVVGPGINLLPEDNGQDIKPVEWMPTCACAYRIAEVRSIGGFGSFFKGYSMCEDLYLSSRVFKNKQLVNTRKARLYHKDMGGASHKDWREIGIMSVINRWMVVREVLGTDTLINKFKLGISLVYGWKSMIINVVMGKESIQTSINRFVGQGTGYYVVLKNNGFQN